MFFYFSVQKLQLIIADFCKDLLDETRSHLELATILNYSPGTNEPLVIEEGAICSLDRLKLAIKYDQKQVRLKYGKKFNL